MGILQAAYRTYESHSHMAGVSVENRETLTPVGHMTKNADMEIEISDTGVFLSAVSFKKPVRTIIPATMASANRTSTKIAPHPLCDNLRYLAPHGGQHHTDYLAQLGRWAASPHSHPIVEAVLAYVKGGTLVADLVACGAIPLPIEEVPGSKYDKAFIRWRVNPASRGGACWEDAALFDCFNAYYQSQCAQEPRDICMITGQPDLVCPNHPKGVVAMSGNAKLLSANDKDFFTYRGRFSEANQAYNVGYTASQKAHNALSFMVANEGVILGGRTFLCWNPQGRAAPAQTLFGLPNETPLDYDQYKGRIKTTLLGYKNDLRELDDVVVAAFDAATTGRLSVTYYSEHKAWDFLDRVESWYTTLCWSSRFEGTLSPSVRRIARCAFGVQRGGLIEADDKVLREHVSHLIACLVDARPLPADVVRALVVKASSLETYKEGYRGGNRETLLTTACAVVRKYHNDKLSKEVWTMSLDPVNTDRSYLFGRLLAVLEHIERDTYDREENREPNAMRMQSMFVRRPMQTWAILEDKLKPYLEKHAPGKRRYLKNMVTEIAGQMDMAHEDQLGRALEETYLLGYYHQRAAIFTKHNKEDTSNGSAEQ